MDKIKYFEQRVNNFQDSDEIIDNLDKLFEKNDIYLYNELSHQIYGLWVLANEMLDYIKAEKI